MKKYINRIIRIISKDKKTAKEYYDEGLTKYTNNEFSTAIRLFTKAIMLDDKMAKAFQLRGASYMKIEKYKKAINDYTAANIIEPDIKEIHFEKGLAYYKLKKYNLAITELNKVTKLDPKCDKTFMFRGLCYFLLKNYETSINDLKMSVELNPENEKNIKPYIDECKKRVSENPKTLLNDFLNNPIVKQQQAIYDMQKNMIDNETSTDKDEIPWGEGEFGYSPSNPIPTHTSFGSISYLAKLKTMKGEKIKYSRLGSTTAINIQNPVDIYEISDSSGFICKLYISMYHKRNSDKVPRNFKRG